MIALDSIFLLLLLYSVYSTWKRDWNICGTLSKWRVKRKSFSSNCKKKLKNFKSYKKVTDLFSLSFNQLACVKSNKRSVLAFRPYFYHNHHAKFCILPRSRSPTISLLAFIPCDCQLIDFSDMQKLFAQRQQLETQLTENKIVKDVSCSILLVICNTLVIFFCDTTGQCDWT